MKEAQKREGKGQTGSNTQQNDQIACTSNKGKERGQVSRDGKEKTDWNKNKYSGKKSTLRLKTGQSL